MKATIYVGDVLQWLRSMPDESVQCVVTSPPYWGLRDYKVEGQIGLEPSPEAYITKMVSVFREVNRVLKRDGLLWLNIGDSYAGSRVGHEGFGTSTLEGNRENQRQANHAARLRRGKDCDPKRSAGATAQPYRAVISSRRRDNEPIPASDYRIDGLKPKDLVGIPWMLAFALRTDGWYLRQDIIWAKPNPMPESVRDRCTKAHEYLFLLSKSQRYYYDADAIKEQVTGGSHARGPGNHSHKGTTAYEDGDEQHRTKGGLVAYAEKKRAGVNPKAKTWVSGWPSGPGNHSVLEHNFPHDSAEARKFRANPEAKSVPTANHNGIRPKQNESFSAAITDLVEIRNKRSVWEIATQPYSEAHFATYPEALVEPCILAGSKPGDTVLDPFCGSGTTGAVALRYHREFVGIELNSEYAELARRRIATEAPMFNEIEVLL